MWERSRWKSTLSQFLIILIDLIILMNLESRVEAILFFRNEPVTLAELLKLLNESRENLQLAISNLQKEYEDRGIVIVTDGENYSFGTHPDNSELIENIQRRSSRESSVGLGSRLWQ